MNEELIQKLQDLFAPALAETGADFVKLAVRQHGRDWTVEALVDKPDGGISIGTCALVNRRMLELLESSRLLGEEFTLEVSSPGLDWPMTTLKDFLRAKGRAVHVFLLEPVAGKIEHDGLIEAVLEEKIVLRPLAKNKNSGGPDALMVEIPFVKIRKAVQII